MPDSNDIVYNEYSSNFFAFLRAFFEAIFGGSGGGATSSNISSWSPEHIIGLLVNTWTALTILSWTISFLLIFGLIYAYIRHGQLGTVETEGLLHQERLYAELNGRKGENQRWEDIQKHIASDHPNDWKLSIIEADVMLGEILDKNGYGGSTIGEQLKGASPTSFTTVDQAWRAHNVRNQIAHGGADFVLTKKMAQDTITQYKMVFQEFGEV